MLVSVFAEIITGRLRKLQVANYREKEIDFKLCDRKLKLLHICFIAMSNNQYYRLHRYIEKPGIVLQYFFV